MLIIRRRVGESIVIGDGIEIEVVEVAGNRVKLGIAAPANVLIFRKELKLAEQENLAAARGVSREAIANVLGSLVPLSSPLVPKP
jgi:carbon storage regulator